MAVISNVWYYALAILVIMSVFILFKYPVVSVSPLVPFFVIGLTLAQMLVEVARRYHYSIIPMLVILPSGSVKNFCKSTGDRK